MTALNYALERTILISAARSTVFRYFKDTERFAAWWGAGSRIEGRPGGAVLIRYPNGVTASGQVLEIVDGERVVFTYGYDEPGKPIPPGGSRVTITLQDHPTGTRLHLRHEVADAATRDHHVPGWRYQLALFANVAAGEQHKEAAALVDRYFALWGEPDEADRRAGLAAVVADDVTFRDAFGCTSGRDELDAHIAAARMHMPGVRLVRSGDLRQCQGTAVVDWVAKGADGQARGSGTSVLDLAPDGRIARVVGLWKS
jgi:uncharacterized protein YndB with AHSA1/START domain